MATAAEKFAGRWFRCETDLSLLVLVGNTGTGKTHTAKRVFSFAMRANFTAFDNGHWLKQFPTVGYYHWPNVCQRFQEKQYGAVEEMGEIGLAVIDDVGAEKSSSAWEREDATDKLCQILSRRERRFTLITTNIAPGQWVERFDVRVADRLLRNSQVVDLTACDSYALTQQ